MTRAQDQQPHLRPPGFIPQLLGRVADSQNDVGRVEMKAPQLLLCPPTTLFDVFCRVDSFYLVNGADHVHHSNFGPGSLREGTCHLQRTARRWRKIQPYQVLSSCSILAAHLDSPRNGSRPNQANSAC